MFDQLLEVQVFVPEREVRQSYDETSTALDNLDAALEALQVVPLGDDVLRRTPQAGDTYDINCTEGATCNFKCGPTAYWECGPSAGGTCEYTCNNQVTCGGNCGTGVQTMCWNMGCTSAEHSCS